ncbi:perilipin-3 [Python bivittatus]|uniref:Perilipin-3 n=1 Tax=Python bivittatus TaxID=176946 RepID=A0A9F2WCQ4_PYTBI|nr:perilipin-3 [Python bivittatus]
MANEGETVYDASKAENVVTRVTNLPLISSAYSLCSSLYHHAKETYPCVNTACNIAELVAAVAMGGARGGAQPLLTHLEPQIATVNQYACKGLDKLEEKLPILHQPTYQVFEDGVTLTKAVVSSTVNAASGAKGIMTQRVAEAVDLTKDIVQDSIALTKLVVNSTVNTALNAANEAKELVTHRVADVVNLSKETVQDSIDLTRSMVSSTVNTAHQVQSSGPLQEGVEMASFFRQALASGVGAMLDKTEEMVDYYLPVPEEELAQLAMEVQGFTSASMEEQQKEQSYFVRLGSLSSKVRSRAYQHSLKRLHLIQENTQNMLSQLQLVINLVEHLKDSAGSQFQEAQQKLNQILLRWTQRQPEEDQDAREDSPQEVELATLAMLRAITQDLGPAYTRLISSVEALPSSLRERVDQARGNLYQLHSSFSSAGSFKDLPSGLLTQSRDKISQAREVLDMLADYLVQMTPLNWIVGPFRPQAAAQGGTGSPQEESKMGEPRKMGKDITISPPVRVSAKRVKRMEKAAEVDRKETTEPIEALKELLAGSDGAPK